LAIFGLVDKGKKFKRSLSLMVPGWMNTSAARRFYLDQHLSNTKPALLLPVCGGAEIEINSSVTRLHVCNSATCSLHRGCPRP
jgi:hypothetical protein